jgi:predicted dehydrogenase
MNPPISFGIVGCGAIGQKRLAALPKGSLVAACDVIQSRAENLAAKAGPQCCATEDLDELLARGPDAVIIATLNASLAPIAERCIEAGKHLLIEKPVATSVEEIDRLSQKAGRSGSLVRAGYNHRYHPAIRKARELFDSGEIGPLMFVRGRYGHGGRVGYDREWRADPRLSGGGELIDQGVHLIDLAGCFMGEWNTAEGHATTYFWDMSVDDNAFINLRNPGGNTAWLHVSCTEWKNMFSLEIYGRTGKLQVEGLGGSYGVERLYHYRMSPEMGPPDTVIYEYPKPDNSWAVETEEFVTDIGLKRMPVPGLKEARMALEAVEAIYTQSGFLTRSAAV